MTFRPRIDRWSEPQRVRHHLNAKVRNCRGGVEELTYIAHLYGWLATHDRMTSGDLRQLHGLLEEWEGKFSTSFVQAAKAELRHWGML
jgi:hypothetical protein